MKPRRWFRFDLGYLLLMLTWLGVALGSLRIAWTGDADGHVATWLFATIAYLGALGAVLGGIFVGRMGWGAISTLAMLLLYVCGLYLGLDIRFRNQAWFSVALLGLSALVLMCCGLFNWRAKRP